MKKFYTNSKDPITNLSAFYYRFVSNGLYSPNPTETNIIRIIDPINVGDPNWPVDIPTRYFLDLPGVPDYSGAFNPLSGRQWTVKRFRGLGFTTFSLVGQDVELTTNTCKIFNQSSENGAFLEVHNESVTDGDKFYIDGYFVNTVAHASDMNSLMKGVSTVVIASDETYINGQLNADYIISASEDAAIKINEIIITLNANGGGEIKFLEGIYNCETVINLLSGITITGSGYNTIFKRKASTSSVFSGAVNDNIILQNFSIDGNKSGFPSGAYGIANMNSMTTMINNLFIINNPSYAISDGYNITNLYLFDNGGGLSSCQRVMNVIAYQNTGHGFDNSRNISGCKSYNNTLAGYYGCVGVSACTAYSNSTHGFHNTQDISSCYSAHNNQHGFYLVTEVSASISGNNGDDGFNSASALSACLSSQNDGNGFNIVKYVSSCRAVTNTLKGFLTCEQLTCCVSSSNTHGYYTCNGMQQNKAISNSTEQYTNCNADVTASGSYTIGANGTDTPSGGFNS